MFSSFSFCSTQDLTNFHDPSHLITFYLLSDILFFSVSYINQSFTAFIPDACILHVTASVARTHPSFPRPSVFRNRLTSIPCLYFIPPFAFDDTWVYPMLLFNHISILLVALWPTSNFLSFKAHIAWPVYILVALIQLPVCVCALLSTASEPFLYS